VTASGRNVALRIYTQAHNADKTAFAMRSLKARTHASAVRDIAWVGPDSSTAPPPPRALRRRP
jgi:hypothetical protein